MFIVIEGIDGAGTGTQSKKVTRALEEQGMTARFQEFPDHHHPIYDYLLHPAMHQEIDFATDEHFLLFLTDMLRFRREIATFKESPDHHFVADRYFSTTLVYQCMFPQLEGKPARPLTGESDPALTIDQALAFAEEFQLTMPDIGVYLDVAAEVAVDRKHDEEGKDEGLDQFEQSVELQKIIGRKYRYIVEESIMTPWVTVDGEPSPDQVTSAIMEKISEYGIAQ